MLKITVLGSWGAYPAAGEATAGYLLEWSGHHLLIDCGSGVLAQLFKYIPIEELDAAILTHYHPDHYADVGCLQHAALISSLLGKRKEVLPIYGHQESPHYADLTYHKYTVGHPVEHGGKLEWMGLCIEFQRTIHPEYNLAMRFTYEGKSLLYTGDAAYSEALIPFMKDADLAICEASLYAGQDGSAIGHCTSTEAGTLADHAGVQKLVLTHFPHYGKLEQLKDEAAKRYSGPIELALSGAVFEI